MKQANLLALMNKLVPPLKLPCSVKLALLVFFPTVQAFSDNKCLLDLTDHLKSCFQETMFYYPCNS